MYLNNELYSIYGDIMIGEDLLDMTLREVLDEFCFVYSPECGYLYGITRWDDAYQMWEEYDLKDEYCFDSESIMAWPMEVDLENDILTLEGLRRVLDYLGIEKKKEEEGA